MRSILKGATFTVFGSNILWGWGRGAIKTGHLLSFLAFRVGAYSNKYGICGIFVLSLLLSGYQKSNVHKFLVYSCSCVLQNPGGRGREA